MVNFEVTNINVTLLCVISEQIKFYSLFKQLRKKKTMSHCFAKRTKKAKWFQTMTVKITSIDSLNYYLTFVHNHKVISSKQATPSPYEFPFSFYRHLVFCSHTWSETNKHLCVSVWVVQQHFSDIIMRICT